MGQTPVVEHIEIFIEKSIPKEHLEKTRGVLTRFCPQGQIVIAALLGKAAQKDEQHLKAAFILIEDFYEKHWKQQPDDVRGNPHADTANHRWMERLYTYLGLTSSWQSLPESKPQEG